MNSFAAFHRAVDVKCDTIVNIASLALVTREDARELVSLNPYLNLVRHDTRGIIIFTRSMIGRGARDKKRPRSQRFVNSHAFSVVCTGLSLSIHGVPYARKHKRKGSRIRMRILCVRRRRNGKSVDGKAAAESQSRRRQHRAEKTGTVQSCSY